ncbi:hypothetical protein DESUT3_09720 [Desulfuromonas versatilis]|uniref:Uncharacterized protein n=1 Tax=Desulfuromonas versatilis TaxID=2802975 RepID=A0ABM8HQ67_9BACT|nr:hypothetical protein DESUT3_09720 [Desulfuromonas versatilis]
MDDMAPVFVEGADFSGHLLCVQVVEHGEAQAVDPLHVERFLARAAGHGEKRYVEEFELFEMLLEISQLLMAERSPVGPVAEQDRPLGGDIPGQVDGPAVGGYGGQVGESAFNREHKHLAIQMALEWIACLIIPPCTRLSNPSK